MAPPTLVPDKTTLERWQREGLTHAEMVARHEQETGIRVSRASISGAMVRYGLAENKPRYRNSLPWRVRDEHGTHYAARMLRLYGRKQQTPDKLNIDESQRLRSWLDMLDREQAIVGYDPDSDEGFYYIDQALKDNDDPAPIRRRRIYTNPR
jgi:hypothetical protein